ncbi:MAG: hypothetical protein R2991_11455 [Thermoanaerobaculia bacterium]
MNAWWSSLSGPLQVFWSIALATSALLALQLLLMLFGIGDGDTDADVHGDIGDVDGHLDADGHGDAGLHVVSMRTVVAFFTGFGWGGVAALESGLGVTVATLCALAAGSAFMLGVFGLMRALYSMRASGTVDYRNAVGTVGTVYLPIPARMEGPGQIEILVQGRLRVVEAFTRADRLLPNRSRVRVVDLADANTLIVVPSDSPAGPQGD